MFSKISLSLLLLLASFSSLQAKEAVAVFCGTDEAIPKRYKEEAFSLGEGLARRGYGLVTGGGNTGLMGAVVSGFMSLGEAEKVQGVVPALFKGMNVCHAQIEEKNLVWTETLHERLQAFAAKSDCLVVLPGGFGTLHELMDFLVPKQWGLTQKKLLLVNTDGYWDPLLAQFQKMVEMGALKERHLSLIQVVKGVEECLQAIEEEERLNHLGVQERYWEKG